MDGQRAASAIVAISITIHAKLKPYSGGLDIEQYQAQLKIVAKFNEWPKDEWNTILATYLDDKAKKLFLRDPSTGPPSFVELSKQLI